MALDRQLIDLPFAAGLGQKTDSKQLAPPKLLTLENGDFTTLKQIRKRPQLVSKGTTSSAKGVLGCEYRDECIALDGESIFSITGSTFNNKGSLPLVSATTESGPRRSSVEAVDSTSSGDWRIVVWQTDIDTLKYGIIHTPTGQTRYYGSLVGGFNPKVVTFGTDFVLFFINDDGGDTLFYITISVPTSGAPTVSAPILLFQMEETGSVWTDADRQYDVCVRASRIYVASHHGYLDTVPYRDVKIIRLSTGFVATTLVSPWVAWLKSASTLSGISVLQDFNRDTLTNAGVAVVIAVDNDASGSGSCYLKAQPVLYNDTDGVSDYAYKPVTSLTGWTAHSPGYVTGVASPTGDLLVAAAGINARENAVVDTHYETVYVTFQGINKVNSPNQMIPVVLAQRVRPCAKILSYTTNLAATGYMLPVIHESGMQPTIFSMLLKPATGDWTTVTKLWAARYLPAQAGGYSTNSSGLPLKWTQTCKQLAEMSGGKWASIRRTDTDETGVDILGFAAATSASAVEYADNLHIASGGMLWMYDGESPVEHGFLMAPTIEGRPFSGGYGSGTHQYAYRFLYAWTDARGQTHRSAPAPDVVLTDQRPPLLTRLTADPIDSSHKVTMEIPSLVETEKTNVVIEIYRTTDASQGGGTVYYLAGTVANSAVGAAVEFQDGMPDDYNVTDADFLREQMQCYTEGGVVQNDPAPSSSILCEHGNRMWTVDAQAPGVLAYTRNLIPVQSGAPGVPAEFSSYFQTRADSTGEEITGIGSLDEKLIVFMRGSLGFVVGDGPDDTGGNGSFNFYPLPHKVGAIKHGSIVSTGKGLIFQSDQGFLLIDRSLQVHPVGLDVETFAKAADIVSGLALTTATQVHMLDATNNRVLAFDTLTEQWSMWPLPSKPASIFSYGTAVEILLANGNMVEQTAWTPVSSYGDLGAWISAKVGTGWVKLGNIAGYERLRRIWLLGDFKSSHKLHWELRLDYSDTAVQSGTFTVAAATAKGGYEVRIDVVRQKCQAFSIVVYDAAPDSGAIGEGMRLSGLTLEVGLKKSGAKLATPQITG